MIKFFVPVFCLLSYFIGSIPVGYILVKYSTGVDLRKFGSKSTGTTNVLRVGSKKIAVLTLLLDIFKGAVVAIMGLCFFDSIYAVIMCFCAIIGHVYPVWLKFKGGKGAATVAGTFFVFMPVTTLISAILWGIIAKILKISSVASLAFSLSVAFMAVLEYFLMDLDPEIAWYAVFVLAFLSYTHKDNIKRLINKQENVFRGKKL